jgi:hypothetical protein
MLTPCYSKRHGSSYLTGENRASSVGNFLVTIPTIVPGRSAQELFRAGLDSARKVLKHESSAVLEGPESCVAAFRRLNGSPVTIASDAHTGAWLSSIGTWFHSGGYASGSNARLLERYLQVGPEKLAEELEGFFVLFVGDPRTHETVLITDIVGSCHCFLRPMPQALAISGSSLLLASLAPCELDQIGCQEYLRTGIIYENRTCWKEIRKLGPASIFRFRLGGEQTVSKYWHFEAIPPNSIGVSDAARTLWEHLLCAATKVGKAFNRPLCDLTGGYDSRALVASLWSAKLPITTTVSGLEDSQDVILSARLAAVAGLPHIHAHAAEVVTFDAVSEALSFTDGEYDLVEYARILQIHRSAMNRFDISINGSFGEVARGYWWELLLPHIGKKQKLNSERVARLRFTANSDPAGIFSPEVRLDFTSHVGSIIERCNAGLADCPNTMQMDHLYLDLRMQRWQGRIASSTNRIWPCLSPFMFRSVLETILASDVRIRRRGLLIRELLSRYTPAWATVPLEHGYPAVPATWKNLHRFAPILGHYGGKVGSRAARILGIRPRANASTQHSLPGRLRLWSEEPVRAVMDHRTMKLNGMLDAAALQAFLTQSKQENFPFEGMWNRILSLEYTLRVLGSIQTSTP